MKYLVTQLGARMHYAVPRMLYTAGALSHFYTDICAVKGWPRLLKGVPAPIRPNGLKRLLGRVPEGVPSTLITSFTRFGWEYQRKRALATTPSARTATSLWAGKRFCELVLRSGFRDAEGIYTFNSAGLEVLSAFRKQGLGTVMEQTIAPREVEIKLLQEELDAFPGWETVQPADRYLDEFVAREHAEWEAAELILCGSEFVRDGIAACGGPVERCVVVPYGVDSRYSIKKPKMRKDPLRVLTAGAIGLRKGTPYVLDAAKRLKGKAVFRMVGGINVSATAEALLRKSVELTGLVPRSEMKKQFAWADVFVLPSLCEGSATVVYEALSAGLPVICTHNTGSVVRHGVDGFIVPLRNSSAIAEVLAKLGDDRELLMQMSESALEHAKHFRMEAYQNKFLHAIHELERIGR